MLHPVFLLQLYTVTPVFLPTHINQSHSSSTSHPLLSVSIYLISTSLAVKKNEKQRRKQVRHCLQADSPPRLLPPDFSSGNPTPIIIFTIIPSISIRYFRFKPTHHPSILPSSATRIIDISNMQQAFSGHCRDTRPLRHFKHNPTTNLQRNLRQP